MLNIISESISSKKTRGPKKVVENLIKGLNQIGYPYVINKQLDCCERLWIHDNKCALEDIKSLPENIKVVIGPNLYVNPENIPAKFDFSKIIYLHPSAIVKNIWEKRNYKNKIVVWPAGIDTDKFVPFSDMKNTVLIYFKNRTKDDLERVENILKNKKISYETITYGSYKETDYYRLLKRTRYIIWLDAYESQGIALEEALASNIPVLAIDKEVPSSQFDTDSTSTPYFDGRCGIKIKGLSDLEKSIDMMENNLTSYKPRNFILENLTLKKQAFEFIKLYETNFGLKVEDGQKETIGSCQPYKTNTWKKYYNKIYERFFNR